MTRFVTIERADANTGRLRVQTQPINPGSPIDRLLQGANYRVEISSKTGLTTTYTLVPQEDPRCPYCSMPVPADIEGYTEDRNGRIHNTEDDCIRAIQRNKTERIRNGS